MVSDDLDQNAFFADADGTVWLGSSRGLIRFRAGIPPAPEPPPHVVITSVSAGTGASILGGASLLAPASATSASPGRA